MKSFHCSLVIWWILPQIWRRIRMEMVKLSRQHFVLANRSGWQCLAPSDAKFNGESPNKPMVAVVSSRLTFKVSLTLLDLPLSMFREGLWIIGHSRVSISYKIFASICDCARLMTTILMSVGSTSGSHWSGGHWIWANRTKKGWLKSWLEEQLRGMTREQEPSLRGLETLYIGGDISALNTRIVGFLNQYGEDATHHKQPTYVNH